MQNINAIYLRGHARQTLALSTTIAHTDPLQGGFYDVWSDIDVDLNEDPNAAPFTFGQGYLLGANNVVTLFVPDQGRIGGILESGTGTFYFHRVGG